MGKLQPHRIEKRAIKKPEELEPLCPRPLIQEMDSKLTLNSKIKDGTSDKNLEHVILKSKNKDEKHLTGLFKIPSMVHFLSKKKKKLLLSIETKCITISILHLDFFSR